MAFWLEKQGYDVTYCSNLDLHVDPGILKTSKAFLSVGHDEYWSRKMYDEVMKARNDGLNLAFFSGDTMWYEIEFYGGSVSHVPCRAFARKGDMPDADKLMGVRSGAVGYGDWIVAKPEHWIYEGTGLRAGDKIPAIIGWEFNGTPADIAGLEVVATSPLYPRSDQWSKDNRHHAVVYPCAKGNWVFNAATIWWAEGLSCPPGHIPARVGDVGGTFGVHPMVQRITANVLNRMIRDSPRRG